MCKAAMVACGRAESTLRGLELLSSHGGNVVPRDPADNNGGGCPG